jgi:hypothetical protein
MATLTNSSTAAVGIFLADGAVVSANAVLNAAGSTIHLSSALHSATQIQNAGTIDGTLSLGGIGGHGSTLTGGINNTGTVIMSGTLLGPIVNAGSGTFQGLGSLGTDSSFVNRDTAKLALKGGGTQNSDLGLHGMTSFTNSSTAAIGVDVRDGGVLNVSGPLTNSGNIQAIFDGKIIANHIDNQAGGTITLASAISKVNGPLNNAGTVTNSGIWTGNATNTGTLTNNNLWTGMIANAGAFANNAGATVSGLLTNTGGTTNNNGALNGGANVSGGTLTGTGTVTNLTVSGGTFAPGNATPGTSMAVTGNLAFQSGALYLVQLNPTTSTFANVTGTATLNGSAGAAFLAGSYVAKQYTILTAAGGVSGTFSSFDTLGIPSGFTASLSYGANNVILDLHLGFSPPTPLNVNQQNVANALVNFFNTTGGIPAVFANLTAAGLTQVAGETATGSQQTTFNAMGMFMGLLTDPFIAGRGDPVNTGPGATPFAAED